MMKLDIKTCQSVDDIPGEDWNTLSQHRGFASQQRLRAVQQYCTDSVDPSFVVAYSQNKLVGALILERVTDPDRENGVVRALLGRNQFLRGVLESVFSPNLAVGAPHGYGGHILLVSALDTESQIAVAESLIAAAESLSNSLHAPLWFVGVLETDVLLLDALRRQGYLAVRYLPLAEMVVEWQTFDDYVSSLKHKSRNVVKDIKRERNRCRSAGVEFDEPTEISSLDSSFVDMANQTYRQHGNSAFPFAPGFYSSMQEQLGDELIVCTARKDREIIGFVTMISDGETAWADHYGLDYDHADSTFVYFNLIYHWPVQKAIDLGLKRIVFGRGQYDLKIRRGCTLTNSYILAKPSNQFTRLFYSLLFRALDKHYAKQLPRAL